MRHVGPSPIALLTAFIELLLQIVRHCSRIYEMHLFKSGHFMRNDE